MDIQKAIREHIEECEHRIEVIKIFMETNEDSDKDQCKENIERLENVKSELEKHIPKKAVKDENQDIRYTTVYVCPTCGGRFTGVVSKHCYHCGQALECDTED